MLIKKRLNKDDLTSFTVLNGCLEKFKLAYGIRWSLAKLTTYQNCLFSHGLNQDRTITQTNIWNMDELLLRNTEVDKSKSYLL